MDECVVAGRVNVPWMMFFPSEDAIGWGILHDVDSPLNIGHTGGKSVLSLLFLCPVSGLVAE